MLKEAEVKLPVENAPRAEPEPSVPEAPATGSEKSVSETAPPASVQLVIPEETQAPVADKAPVPNDGGSPVQGNIANGPKSGPYRYMIRIGSFVDREKAEEIKDRIRGKGYNAAVKTLKHKVLGEVFAVQLPPVNSVSRAARLMTLLSGEIEGEPVIIKVPWR